MKSILFENDRIDWAYNIIVETPKDTQTRETVAKELLDKTEKTWGWCFKFLRGFFETRIRASVSKAFLAVKYRPTFVFRSGDNFLSASQVVACLSRFNKQRRQIISEHDERLKKADPKFAETLRLIQGSQPFYQKLKNLGLSDREIVETYLAAEKKIIRKDPDFKNIPPSRRAFVILSHWEHALNICKKQFANLNPTDNIQKILEYFKFQGLIEDFRSFLKEPPSVSENLSFEKQWADIQGLSDGPRHYPPYMHELNSSRGFSQMTLIRQGQETRFDYDRNDRRYTGPDLQMENVSDRKTRIDRTIQEFSGQVDDVRLLLEVLVSPDYEIALQAEAFSMTWLLRTENSRYPLITEYRSKEIVDEGNNSFSVTYKFEAKLVHLKEDSGDVNVNTETNLDSQEVSVQYRFTKDAIGKWVRSAPITLPLHP